MRTRRLLPLGALAAALVVAGSAGGTTRALTIHFSFSTYANNVRVVAPLVGRWQLGTAHLKGSGELGSGADGMIVGFGDPLLPRYGNSSLRAQVISYRYQGGAHGAFDKLVLTVQVLSASNGGPRCDPGVQGTVTLYDSDAKISNGENADYVVMGHWTAARCPTFVQGWTNADGGPRTSPAHGGPPRGGQWAIVNISAR
jgi:hypothetical protein